MSYNRFTACVFGLHKNKQEAQGVEFTFGEAIEIALEEEYF